MKDVIHNQTPKRGPNGFEWYAVGPDNARLDIYRKQTPLHTLIVNCFDHDITQPLYWVCNTSSRLPGNNELHYFLLGSRYEFNGQQFQYAEQIDEGLRSLIDSFTIKSDKT